MKWVGIAIAILLAFALISVVTWFPGWFRTYRYSNDRLNDEVDWLQRKLDTIRRMKWGRQRPARTRLA